MKEDKRIIYLDELRILAVIAVIFIHVAAQNLTDRKIPFNTWFVFNFWDSIVQWAVPVFIMISGAVFLDRNHEINVKRLYAHNIFRIVTAYFFWSFLYAVYQVHTEGGGVLRVLALTLDGHYHLWYLYMITSLYIFTPLIKKLSDEDFRYLIFVSFILSFFIPTVMNIINAILQVSGSDLLQKAVDQIFSPYLIFMKYVKIDYVFYYVLGYFLNNREFERKQLNMIYIISVLSFVFTVVFSSIITWFRKSPYGIYDIFTVNILFEAVGVFICVKNKSRKNENIPEKKRKIIRGLSGCTFGIYLVHAMILEAMNNEMSINTLSFTPLLSVPVIAGTVFLISLGITLIIKKIPVLNKYMI